MLYLLYLGAAQADVAILVVNAARGEFETGFEAGGQTREHAMLIRSLGMCIIIASNASSERYPSHLLIIFSETQ